MDRRTVSPYSMRQLLLRESKDVKTITANRKSAEQKDEKISMCVMPWPLTLAVFGLNHHLIRPFR